MAPSVVNPFARSQRRYLDAEREFLYFVEEYEVHFAKLTKRLARFSQLDAWLGARISINHVSDKNGRVVYRRPPPTIQIDFGTLPAGLRRRASNGKIAHEKGASLVYSFGPNGAVAVQLYPARGELGSAVESMILLRIGYFTCAQLLEGAGRDLKDWVAYEHVTAIDGDPTRRERWRIAWLRLQKAVYMEGKHKPALLPKQIWDVANQTFKLVAGAALAAFFKIVFPIAIGFTLGLISR